MFPVTMVVLVRASTSIVVRFSLLLVALVPTTRLENDVLEPLLLYTRRLLFYFYFCRDFVLDV